MGHIIKCDYGSVPASLSDAKGCLAVDVQEYATAQDMMQSTCLKLGYAHTLGFYEVGDGGEAYYTVVASPTGDEPNGMDVLQCWKYVAELIPEKFIIPEQFGAKGDATFDNSEIMQRIVDLITSLYNKTDKGNSFVVTGFGNSIYGVHQFTINELIHLKDIYFKELISTDYVIKLNHLGIDTATNSGNELFSVSIDGDYKADTLLHITYSRSYNILNCYFVNARKYGIYSSNGNIEVSNSFIYNHTPKETLDSCGLYFGGTDSKVYSCHIKNHKTGVHVRNGITYLENIHTWLTDVADDDLIGSIAFLIHGASRLLECYADTYETAVVNDNRQAMEINGMHYYENADWYNSQRTSVAPTFFKFIQSVNNIDVYPTGCQASMIRGLTYSQGDTGIQSPPQLMNITPNEWYTNTEAFIWPYELYSESMEALNPNYTGAIEPGPNISFVFSNVTRSGRNVVINGQFNWEEISKNAIVFSINDGFLRPKTRNYFGLKLTNGDNAVVQLNPNNGVFNMTFTPTSTSGSAMFALSYII